MVRRYRKRNYRKNKYNIENRPFETESWSVQNGFKQTTVSIVPPTTTEGVRKAGRFTITMSNTQVFPYYWALVYIPEGGTTSSLFPDANTLLNPSNYVLASGITGNSSGNGTSRIFSKLFKNLKAGDQIQLYIATSTANENPNIPGLIRYAICYN